LPSPQPNRNVLLASIQGKGVHTLRKTPKTPRYTHQPAQMNGTTTEDITSNVGDLTSALVRALDHRNRRMQSGDNEDSGDEDSNDESWE
jgi:hypothetical protein